MNKKLGNKILSVILLISLISTIITGSLALFAMGSIKSTVSNLPENMKNELVEKNRDEYIKKGETEIGEALKLSGEIFDSILKDMASKVKDAALSIDKIYANTEYYSESEKRVYPPDINGNDFQVQVIYETDKAPEDIQSSIDFSANTADILLDTSKSDPNIISTFLSLEKGFTLFADNNPKGKFNSKGGVISYNPKYALWYKNLKSTLKGQYTGVGYDKHGKNPSVMYGYPVTGGGFRGSVCIKYALTPALSNLAFNDTTVIIYDRDGNITYSTATDGTLFAKDNQIPSEFSSLLNTEKGFNNVSEATINDEEFRVGCYKTLSDDLTIACVKSLDDIFASAVKNDTDINAGATETAKNIYKIIGYAAIALVLIILLVIIICLKLSSHLTKIIVNPVKRITNGLECVAEGNFEYRVTPDGENEIRTLTDSFNNLGPRLSKMVEDAKLEVYEYEKANSEGNVSTRVQRDSNNITFPESDSFEIFASVKPAKFICSDFYDAFNVNSNHMAFTMIDTNQGGIDATFTGKIIKELIKAHSVMGESPYEILTNVNAQISEMNKKEINASVFMGILEITSGKLVFVNAGFDTVLIKRAGVSDYESIKCQANPRLMTKSDNLYVQESFVLTRGDTLYICSDGISSASDETYEKYGLESLKKILAENERKPLNQLLNYVHDDVRKFVKGAPQMDDISMMILKIKG